MSVHNYVDFHGQRKLTCKPYAGAYEQEVGTTNGIDLRRSKKRFNKRTMLLAVVLCAGGLMCVATPFMVRQLNRRTQGNLYQEHKQAARSSYLEASKSLREARHYNQYLAAQKAQFNEVVLPKDQEPEVLSYERQLAGHKGDVMAWLTIPSLDLELPIYHGSSDEVLAKGVGHLEQSSLPTGGKSTHCVLVAHSGMAAKTLFDDINQLKPGNAICIEILGRTITYGVMAQEVVIPQDVSSLAIKPQCDLLTLVTCTPPGVNTHRLLVYAKRIDLPWEVVI